ncbi:MAG: hypothetical protein R3F62_26620 [Planctomycetota bacterium]
MNETQATKSARRGGWIAAAVVLLAVAHPWLTPVRADGKDSRAIRATMARWKNELGLKNCAYCHVKDGRKFDYEAATPKKALAHFCEENFVEKLQTKDGKPVSCATCHDHKVRFLPREGGDAQGSSGEQEDDGDEVEGR